MRIICHRYAVILLLCAALAGCQTGSPAVNTPSGNAGSVTSAPTPGNTSAVTPIPTPGNTASTVTPVPAPGNASIANPMPAPGNMMPEPQITSEQAQAAALQHAGLTTNDVSHIWVEFEYDDGRAEYQVNFISGTMEYDIKVDAVTGSIVGYDMDSVYD